jgi:hypothetical protein
MSRNFPLSRKPRAVVAALALTVCGVAFADDNSMSRWTGDSYAYFNDLDYSPGHFNVARAPRGDDQTVVAKSQFQDWLEKRAAKSSRASDGGGNHASRAFDE